MEEESTPRGPGRVPGGIMMRVIGEDVALFDSWAKEDGEKE